MEAREVQKATEPLVLEFSCPQREDIYEALKKVNRLMGYDRPYPRGKIQIDFSEPVEVQINRFKRVLRSRIRVTVFKDRFGCWAYTFYRSSGYYLDLLDITKIIRITVFPEPTKEQRAADRKKKEERFLRLLHPNVWQNLRNAPSQITEAELTKIISIKGRFPQSVHDEIARAFEERAAYHYRWPGRRRSLRVETGTGADGIFRAWYSSEYAGCANGSYYILINPTTAAYVEDD